jgi:hypothetical protein
VKLRNLALVILLALSLSGCSWLSNNSDDDSRYYSKDRISDTDILSENDVRLIDVKIDSRDFSTLEISTCPLATQVGTGSCNAVTP